MTPPDAELISTFESGLNHDKTKFNLNELGIQLNENQTKDIHGDLVRGKHYESNDYAEYIIPKNEIGKGLPETEHVMYMKGIEVTAESDAEVLAQAIQSYFDRTYQHYCSHRQIPSSGEAGYDAIVKKGNVIYFAHPLFTQYNQNAPRWCKMMFLNALAMTMGSPLLTHNGPSTLLANVNAQEKENRWVVHLLHYIPERRSDIDIIEDVIPLYKVKLTVKTIKEVQSIVCVPAGETLDFVSKEGGVEFIVPEIHGHQMISIQYKF